MEIFFLLIISKIKYFKIKIIEIFSLIYLNFDKVVVTCLIYNRCLLIKKFNEHLKISFFTDCF